MTDDPARVSLAEVMRLDVVMAVVIAWALVASAALGALWQRMRHAEQDVESGWQAVGDSLDEIKGHLERLYRRTDVLPDGGVVDDE